MIKRELYMFKLSKTTEYALISINHIKNCELDLPISVRSISDEYNIPYELLAKILQKLSKNKILISVHGPKGGYMIDKKQTSKSLVELMEILEGPFGIVSCINDNNCEQLNNCNILSPLEKINSQLYKVFNKIKLNQIT